MFAVRNAFMTGSAAPAASVTFLGISSLQRVGTSFSYTVPTGASLLAVVVCSRSGSVTGSSVTVDSVAMTKSVNYKENSQGQTLDIYTKLNPTAGSRTIVPSGSITGTNTIVYALAYSNCVSLGTTYGYYTFGQTTAPITFGSVANSVGLYVAYQRTNFPITMSGTGVTSRVSGNTATAAQTYNIGDIPTGGTVTNSTGVLSPIIAGIQLLPT